MTVLLTQPYRYRTWHMWKVLMTMKVTWCHMGRQTGSPPGEWAWLKVGYEIFKKHIS